MIILAVDASTPKFSALLYHAPALTTGNLAISPGSMSFEMLVGENIL